MLIAFGLIALDRLSLREYPDIDPPIVTIETQYTGAVAQTIENKITKVIESRISGISGLRFIDSKSVDGLSTISIEFNLKRNIDNAANDVREGVSQALDDLPEGVKPPKVFKVDSNNSVIMWLNLASSKINALQLTDYAERHIVDKLSIIDGVARVRIGGARRYAMRIWLDRKAMVGKKITVQDIALSLRENNIELPGGRVESDSRDFTIWLKPNFISTKDFKRLVIKRDPQGHLIRLGDVADVKIGAENRRTELRGNRVNMVGLGIIKQSKANTIEVTTKVKQAIKNLKLPQGTTIEQSYDTSVFIRAAIVEVFKTFIIALVLVLVVIHLFLGRLSNVVIPFITIPVSLIASFIVLYLLNFSLNLLTLLGLVLAIGLVVDDAIVVLENINRRLKLGEPPLLASYRGTRQVGFAVIATTMVLLAVFLPISMLEGNVGRLFTEFAITISAAVIFSSVSALTLTPVMCAKLLSKKATTSKADKIMLKINHYYQQLLQFFLDKSYLVIIVFIGLLLSIFFLFKAIPSQLVPKEDRGAFFIFVKGPEGASFSYMKKYMREIEDIMMQAVDEGSATRALSIAPLGFGKSESVNSGLAIVIMKDWHERVKSSFAVIGEMQQQLMKLPGVLAFPVMRSGLANQGVKQPVQFVIGNTNYKDLVKYRDILMLKARQNKKLLNIDSDFKPTKIQLELQINHERAAELGITTRDIGLALETMFGSKTVTSYVKNDEEYDVILESDLSQKATLADLHNIYLRSSITNRMVSLNNVAIIKERTTPNALFRYNRIKAITITASLAKGYSLSEALKYLNQIADENFPKDVSIDYKGQSRDFYESKAGIVFTFGLAISILYLVMAAQFGSFIHPLVLLMTSPMAIAGALFGLYVCGDSLNIYSQIGLIMLIGLAAKNGILIIEFINQLREQGEEFLPAIIKASVIRLRPVLMTAISTIIGSLPLVLATGAGSESRFSIGIVILFGVLLATSLTIFIVPVTYAKLCRYTKPRNYIADQIDKLDNT